MIGENQNMAIGRIFCHGPGHEVDQRVGIGHICSPRSINS